VYELPRDGFDLHARIDDLAWEDQQLTIRGRAAVGELEMTEKSRLDVWLQTPEGDEVRYRTRRYPVMRHTGRVEHAGFEFSVPLERLKSGGQWLAKDWTLFAAVCCGRERRSGPVHRVMPGRDLWATYQEVQAGTWVVPQLLPSGVFALRVRLVAAVVDEVARSHDTVTLGGTFAGQQAAGDVAVVVSRPGLPARRVVTDVRQSRRGCRFRATLDLRDLAGRADYDDPLAQSTRWQVRLEVDGEQRPLGVHPDFAQPDFEIGARSVSFVRNARANLVVIESQRTAIVSRVAWVAPGVLRIEAHQVPSGERTRKLVMRAVLPGRVAVERRLRVEQGDEWFADVDVRELVRSADDAADQTVLTPVQIVWRLAFEADDKPVPLRARPPLFERLPPAVRLDDRDVLVESYRRESLQVVVRRRSASGAGG
jgi:hypothetical protein